jgi:hypothetical protein
MSWAEKLRKNKDIEQKHIEKKEIKNEVKIFDPYSILNFMNIDDEFEYKYLDKMTDISIEFREYVSSNYLPFMNKVIHINYTTYDFIKDYSYEYDNTLKYVNNYNKSLIDEYNKEQEEIQKEIDDQEGLSD